MVGLWHSSLQDCWFSFEMFNVGLIITSCIGVQNGVRDMDDQYEQGVLSKKGGVTTNMDCPGFICKEFKHATAECGTQDHSGKCSSQFHEGHCVE